MPPSDDVDDLLAGLEADFLKEQEQQSEQQPTAAPQTVVPAVQGRGVAVWCPPCEAEESKRTQTQPIRGFSFCNAAAGVTFETKITFRCFECAREVERPVLCQQCRVVVYW